MGEEQGADVGARTAHHAQLTGDVTVVARHAGVDAGPLAGVLEKVGVDHALVADPVDARCDLHRNPLKPARSSTTLPRWLPFQAILGGVPAASLRGGFGER